MQSRHLRSLLFVRAVNQNFEAVGDHLAAPLARRGEAKEPPEHELERTVRQICLKLKALGGSAWGGPEQARAIRRGLIDARLNKNAMHALNLLLKN